MATFLGMRGTGDWSDDARPGNWREKILELRPNGSALLTAITSMIGRGESIDDIRHNWKTRSLATQAGAVANVYIDSGLTTPYVYSTHHATYGVAGAYVYVNVALEVAKMFRAGHQAILRDSDHPEVDVNVKVTTVNQNGANSYLKCLLLEDDDNGSASYNLATVDRVMVAGNINAQGADRPSPISYDPVDVYNLTQIFRTPLEITGSAMATRLRGRDAYLDQKEQALLYHGVEMEQALIWSILSERTGDNGKPENTMMGVRQFIKTYASSNVDNFRLNASYSGQTWQDAGEDWMDNMLKTIYGNVGVDGEVEALALCGPGAMLGIKQMVKANSMYEIQVKEKAYGISVVELHTVFASKPINLKIHPLFTRESSASNMIMIIPPSKIRPLPLKGRDTHFKPDKLYEQGGATGADAKKEEFLTEITYEFALDGPWGILEGVGQDNAV